MPKIVTKNYSDAVFFIPYTADKSEGIWARPITRSQLNEAYRKAALEAGADTELTEALVSLRVLENSLVDWKGFFDANAKPIEYSRETLRAVWENDPAIFTNIYWRIREIARMGELDDQKN
ncbi:hypothetical protein [uncultured Bilophila sp.]|uniref:hypothetical protein n=1 Tax=uncultured Bilophila sp. TaxID=529385 RepID=UPI00266EF459|nr:hypothetical protein [uncultured Bilophila sp.]